jgi:lysyl-tRNA synthetase class 2
MDRLAMMLTDQHSIQDILFFPQMRPEKKAEKKVELNESEKLVFDILSKNSPMDLNDLKTQSALSGKQWDKSIKGLTSMGVAKVTKTDSGLTVEVV